MKTLSRPEVFLALKLKRAGVRVANIARDIKANPDTLRHKIRKMELFAENSGGFDSPAFSNYLGCRWKSGSGWSQWNGEN